MSAAPTHPYRERWLPFFCGAMVLFGVALHLTARDRLPAPWFAVYYALPRPLLLALAILGGLRARTVLGRSLMAALAISLAGWVASCDVAWTAGAATQSAGQAPAAKVVFWNVGHNLVDDYVAVDEVLATSPVAVGLVETGILSPEWIADWQAKHPEYSFVVPHPGMLLAVRGEVLNQAYHRLPHNSHVAWAETRIDGQRVRIAVVDILANPWISRENALRRLSERLSEWDNGRPLIVMGDFNTPVESVHMDVIRGRFREAFLAAGSGYVPSWPWPAPVLKLDQLWISRQVNPRRAWQTGTWRSDHCMQWLEFDVSTVVVE